MQAQVTSLYSFSICGNLIGDTYRYILTLSNGLFTMLTREGYWKFATRDGKIIEGITLPSDENIYSPSRDFFKQSSNKHVAVYLENFWHFLSQDGNIIQDKYESVDLGKGYASLAGVKQNGLWGLVDYNGNNISPCKYTYIQDAGVFHKILAKRDDKFGYLCENGNECIPFIYDTAKLFSFDRKAKTFVAKVGMYTNGLLDEFVIDETGKRI